MIAVDANILVYADRREAPLHMAALESLDGLVRGDAAWGLPVFSMLQFLRVVTHPRVAHRPTPPEEAFAFVDGLLSSPTVRVLSPSDHFWPVLKRLLVDCRIVGSQVFDAQIAAVCIEHGADTILTEDRDFRKFPGLAVKSLPR